MPPERHTRLLIRGSLLLIVLLVLWWWFLVGPMLVALQSAGRIFLPIEDTPGGNWTLRVALDRILAARPGHPVAQQIHSIDFDMQREDLVAFTFSIPVFWSLMLAAADPHRHLRPLLLGTAAMAIIELAMFVAFAQIAARNSFAALAGSDDGIDRWARHLGGYLIAGVLPFLLPFVVALTVHRELRVSILSWAQAPETRPELAPSTRPRTRKTVSRGRTDRKRIADHPPSCPEAPKRT